MLPTVGYIAITYTQVDKEGFKMRVASLALEIFTCYETQILRVAKEAGWSLAAAEMAADAVDRIFDHLSSSSLGEEEEEEEPSTDLVFRSLLRGRSKGIFHRGRTVLDRDSGEKLHTGELYGLPAVVVAVVPEQDQEGGRGFEAFTFQNSQPGTHGFRLAFAFEEELLRGGSGDYARPLEDADLSGFNPQLVGWQQDALDAVRLKVLKDLKDVDEKLDDLQSQVAEVSKAIIANQEEIKGKLDSVSAKVMEGNAEAEARDLRIQALVLHQGRDLKNILRQQQQNGQDGGGRDAAMSIGKWWPRQQTTSKNFVARSAEDGMSLAERLHWQLLQSRSLVLTGMGGAGKTTTVKWFATEFCGEFQHVIWLNSEGREVMSKSFASLADALLIPLLLNDGVTHKSLEDLSAEIFKELQAKKCLFLLDNVDDPSVGNLLSRETSHFTLLTSRLQRWDDLVVVEVGLFTQEEAMSFLRKSIAGSKFKSEDNLKSLTEELQYLPLAIKQAIATIDSLDLSVADYLDEFRRKSEAVLGLATDAEKTILATWSVSIDQMMQRDQTIGQLALILLQSISYLYPENIQREFFQDLAPSKMELSQAIELLRQYSLIKVHDGTLKVHRLVQETMRINLGEQDREEKVLQRVLQVLHKSISLNQANRTLATHMRTAVKFATPERHKLILLRLREVEAAILQADKDFTGALEVHTSCQDGYKEVRYGSETHGDVLLAECRLARIKFNLGQKSSSLRRMYKVNHVDTKLKLCNFF